MRVLSFSDQARWHLAAPTPVEQVLPLWTDLQASGLTYMGAALRELASVLRTPPMEQRALPPVLVLVSDGAPTDDFTAGLRVLMAALGTWCPHRDLGNADGEVTRRRAVGTAARDWPSAG